MSRASILGVVAMSLLGAAACGGIAVLDDGDGSGGGVLAGATSSQSTTRSASATTLASQASVATTARSGTTQIASTTGAAMSMDTELSGVALTVDCGAATPGKASGWFEGRYKNYGRGPGSLNIESAFVSVPEGDGWVLVNGVVDPINSGVIPSYWDVGSVYVTHAMTLDAIELCGACDEIVELYVIWDDFDDDAMTFRLACTF